MRIHGMVIRYHGDNWIRSKDRDWKMDYVDEESRVSATKVGERKIFGIMCQIYACKICPHTFYAY